MSITLVLGAICVGASLPLIWWALSGPPTPKQDARSNLLGSSSTTQDLREQLLAESASKRMLTPMMKRFAERGRKITPQGTREKLQQRIQMAGMTEEWTTEHAYAMKAIFGFAGVVLALLFIISNPTGTVVVLSIGVAVLLYFTPDLYLRSKADSRQSRIEQQLADVLDQITICVEAGLSFDNAALRVSAGEGPLPEELGRTLQDIQLGMRRAEALDRLLERTDVTDLRAFIHAFNQAEKYGIPVAQILRVQSTEIRLKRRQRAEERAMKLPVKLVFPVVLFILPALFIVVAGPAVIRLTTQTF
jgi:tight adherence protein C